MKESMNIARHWWEIYKDKGPRACLDRIRADTVAADESTLPSLISNFKFLIQILMGRNEAAELGRIIDSEYGRRLAELEVETPELIELKKRAAELAEVLADVRKEEADRAPRFDLWRRLKTDTEVLAIEVETLKTKKGKIEAEFENLED